ncbi:MAG TPA: DUF4232 domain-containing protein [Mycobacteriales bacterium]|jgi:hypothetical protein|nr:DUF4232 domain-containing protein [Mycobacteriales bacterium]
MKHTSLSLSALALLAAGCGVQAATQTTAQRPAARPAAEPAQVVAVAATTTPSRCTVGQLSLRLGTAGHAAGSTYQPIVFTNTGTTSCTLRGYPGVSYVALRTGAQVGAAATRDPAVTVRTVTLAPGGHAASLLQLVNYLNYPATTCAAKPVSGLRLYPPGSKSAAYLAFAHTREACSSTVRQLSVRAVVKGRSGQ